MRAVTVAVVEPSGLGECLSSRDASAQLLVLGDAARVEHVELQQSVPVG